MKGRVDPKEFQEEFYNSVDADRWSERMGEFILTLTDNIAGSGIIQADDHIINELKGDVIMTVLEKLWVYKDSGTKSNAMYYAIAIIKNKFRRLARDRLGASATKTLYGTDSFYLEYDEDIKRSRKKKATYVSIDYLENRDG